MKNAQITRKNATVSATYLPYAAYKRAEALALEHKGEIGKTAEGLFKATFANAKTAEKFKAQWTAEYNANRKVDLAPTKVTAPAPKTKSSKPTSAKGKTETVTVTLNGVEYTVNKADLVPTQAPKAKAPAKKSTTSAKKAPRKAKGEAFNFGSIKGKTNADKNKALHAMLVSMGMKDSRTAEYQAVWNARPWAN